MLIHPSHDTRISDASSFDEICSNCGATDRAGEMALGDPCPSEPPEREAARTGARFSVPSHPYKLETFDELPPRVMGPDGRCTCTCADYCPLGRKGSEPRCTLAELNALDDEARRRRAWQSGNDY